MEPNERRYLGDGVYASHDGFHLVLTANVPTTDTIALDPYVQKALRELLESMKKGGETE